MIIQVKPVSASLTRNTDFFGTMDPYVVCIYAGQSQRTKTHDDGGKQPKWEETFFFGNCENVNEKMKVQVWDDNYLSDGLIGEGYIDMSSIVNNPMFNANNNVMLSYNGQMAGMININVLVTRSNANHFNNQGNWGTNAQNQAAPCFPPVLAPFNQNQNQNPNMNMNYCNGGMDRRLEQNIGNSLTQNLFQLNNGW